jgi:hypothetical protein
MSSWEARPWIELGGRGYAIASTEPETEMGVYDTGELRAKEKEKKERTTS